MLAKLEVFALCVEKSIDPFEEFEDILGVVESNFFTCSECFWGNCIALIACSVKDCS